MSLNLQKALAMLDQQTRRLFIKVKEDRERLSLYNKQVGDVESGKKKKTSSSNYYWLMLCLSYVVCHTILWLYGV
ncbi:hypothetical protein TSUD_356680 [Trifolium subterraneum]|uniref:Uncharacterized protein n=1 Tax=Trifolium subterraneum TaxID=3900 RepID=A0A2Z6MQG7_TRISU|nr:hypothetical protein TSUD_356680 [Trifolium subterraneum]